MDNRTATKKVKQIRIIWAILIKDVIDAFKNKTIIMNLLVIVLIILAYRYGPSILLGSDTYLIIHDGNHSGLVERIRAAQVYNPLAVDSIAELERILDDIDTYNIALVVPPGTDINPQSSEPVVLHGYTLWSERDKIDGLKSEMESGIAAILSHEVRIDIVEAIQYSADASGPMHMASVALVVAIFFTATLTVPQLMFEEKQAKTLDALRVSPASMSHIVIGKALSGLFFSTMISVVCFVMFSSYVIHWGLAVLTFMSAAIFAVGIGLSIGILVEQRHQLMMAAFLPGGLLILPVFLIGIESILPGFLRQVFPLIPTVAQAILFRHSCSHALHLPDLQVPTLVILGSVILIFGLLVFQMRRLDRQS